MGKDGGRSAKKEDSKIHLSNLAYLELIKKMCHDNPALLYFICYLGVENYPKLSFFDIESYCRKLQRVYAVTNFKEPSERHTHQITSRSCHFTFTGKQILKSLKELKICSELKKLAKYNTKRDYEKAFQDRFTFEIDKSNKINKKIHELNNKLHVSLPANGFKFKSKKGDISWEIHYTIDQNEIFHLNIKYNCECGAIFDESFSQSELVDDPYFPYKLNCSKCNAEKWVSKNFRNIQ